MSPPPPVPPGSVVTTTGADPNPAASADPKTADTFPPDAAALLRDLDMGSAETATGGHGPDTDAGVSPRNDAIRIPGYEILGELGRGGMGVVYKARQVSLNRVVALKTIRGGRVNDKDLARFLIEAEAVAAIEHANVVRVYEYGEHDGQPYMALEYLPGGSLADRLEQSRASGSRLAPDEVAGLIATIARGVAAAHALRIVHRDLKPANVLFGVESARPEDTQTVPESRRGRSATVKLEDQAPKVADFGLAKRGTTDLTQTQAVMGTPAYMAPEQADGRTKFVGPSADVWALGVILYECLHGERPFQGADFHSLRASILSDEVPDHSTNSRIPRELDLICRKCLEKVPADRYPSASELADDLGRFTRGEPVSVRPLGTAARTYRWVKRNPAVAGLLGLILLISLGLVGSLFAQYRQALASATLERRAAEKERAGKELAEKLAADNAALAREEAARREEAERLRKLADAEAARANQVSGFMTDLFKGQDPLDLFGESLMPQNWAAQRAKTADVLLQDAAQKFRTELKDQPLARAKLMSAVANSMTNLGEYKTAGPLLIEALELRKAHLPADHQDVVLNELDLGRMYWNMGDFEQAAMFFRGALEKQRRNGAPEADILTTRLFEAVTYSFTDAREADVIFKEVIAGRERLFGPNHHTTITVYIAYVGMLLNESRTADLIPVIPHIIEPLKTHPNPQFRHLGEIISAFQTGVATSQSAASLGGFAESARRRAEINLRKALRLGETHLPSHHWLVGMIRFELADVLSELGQGAEADKLFDRLVADVRKVYGLAHPKVMFVGSTVGRRWAKAGKVAEARKLWDEIDAANRAQFGADNFWRGELLLQRVRFESEYGTPADARRFAEQALDLIAKGKVAPSRLVCSNVLHAGRTFARPGLDPAGRAVARGLFDQTRRYVVAVYGEKTREMCIALMVEGTRLHAMGQKVESCACLQEAHGLVGLLRDRADDGDRHDLAAALANSLNEQGRFAEAEPHAAAALALSRADWVNDRNDDAWALVTALVGQRKFADAVPVVQAFRRWRVVEKAPEVDLTWLDLWTTNLLRAGGDRDGYREALDGQKRRAENSTDVNTLARLCWVVGIWPDADPAEAGAAAKRLAPVIGKHPKFAWGQWAWSLALLRSGDVAAAEAAVKKATEATQPGKEWPVADLIRGLCAVARDDRAAARKHLADAEAFIESLKPSKARPFAYESSIAHDRFLTELLLTQLRSALTPLEVAPPPREVVK